MSNSDTFKEDTISQAAFELTKNIFFQRLIHIMKTSLADEIANLDPLNKDDFTVLRSQQMVIESIEANIMNAATEKAKDPEGGVLI